MGKYHAYRITNTKDFFEMATAVLPNRVMKLGKKWSKHIKMELGMGAVITSEFTLKEIHPEYFLIIISGETQTDDKDA
ncbi:MAG: DUF6263 family protein [Bacteroidota bacterium]